MKIATILFSTRTRLVGLTLLGAMALSACTIVPTSPRPSWLPARPSEPVDLAGWTGTYRTTLPCAHCAGLRMELMLHKDATYSLLLQELGTERPAITRKGGFVFNADETRITLDANGQGRSFDILPPDRLRMLGKDGKPVAGAEAYRFILKK